MLMGIHEPLAAVRMIVAAIYVEYASIRHLDSRHDLPKLEQESHWLPALVTTGFVRVLDQHWVAADVGDVGGVEAVPIDVRAKDLGQNSSEILGVWFQWHSDLGEIVTEPFR